MNKKFLNIGLVFSLLFIWGYVGIQFFEFSSGEEYHFPEKNKVIEVEKDIKTEKYTLLSTGQTNHPFGKVSSIKKRTTTRTKKKAATKPKKKIVKKAPIKWPNIQYSGVMSNHGNFLALVHIDKADKMINEGDSYRGIKFDKISYDSLIVSYQKEQKVIYK